MLESDLKYHSLALSIPEAVNHDLGPTPRQPAAAISCPAELRHPYQHPLLFLQLCSGVCWSSVRNKGQDPSNVEVEDACLLALLHC